MDSMKNEERGKMNVVRLLLNVVVLVVALGVLGGILTGCGSKDKEVSTEEQMPTSVSAKEDLSYMSGDDNAEFVQWCYTVRQTFTPLKTLEVKEITLKLYRSGNPGTKSIISIRTMDSEILSIAYFNGNDLTTDVQGEWITVPMPKCSILGETEYYLQVDAGIGVSQKYEKIYWRYDSTFSSYENGEASKYSCGSDWTPIGGDFMFSIN